MGAAIISSINTSYHGNLPFSSTIAQVEFLDELTKEDKEHAKLTVRAGCFFELLQYAKIMNSIGCSYRDAVKRRYFIKRRFGIKTRRLTQ